MLSEDVNRRLAAGAGCYTYVPDGWINIVEDLNKSLASLYPDYTIDQIKEKFGTLMFYASGIENDGYQLIKDAERKSELTCMDCAGPGRLISQRGWYMTVCTDCE